MLESAVDYESRVAHERAAKDAFFRTSPHSPVPAADRVPDHSCPLIPAENRLPDRIDAGERLPTAGVR